MSVIAIIGAGPLGGALAHTLALRSRISEVRLIDPQESVARGKALDILQSGPIDSFGTALTGSGSILSAAGADVVVVADAAEGSEHAGEPALAAIRQLVAAGITAPLLFAGASQRELMQRCVSELRIPAARVLGSAPAALSAALRALVALALDTSPVEISLNVVGIPPRRAVVAWQEGTASGQPLSAVLPPHEMTAITARIEGLWPPGPYALATVGARVAEALCTGSRRQYTCFVAAERSRIAAMPVELRRGGIKRVVQPTLSVAERTALDTAVSL